MINRLDHPALSELEQALCTVRSILERNRILLLEEYAHWHVSNNNNNHSYNCTLTLAEELNHLYVDLELINQKLNLQTGVPLYPKGVKLASLVEALTSQIPADSEPSSEQSP